MTEASASEASRSRKSSTASKKTRHSYLDKKYEFPKLPQAETKKILPKTF